MHLGELMYESHASYAAAASARAGTDRLVELVRSEGPAAGLYGARITGGGSGGTVAVIGRRGAAPAIARVADAYEQQTGYGRTSLRDRRRAWRRSALDRSRCEE